MLSITAPWTLSAGIRVLKDSSALFWSTSGENVRVSWVTTPPA